ncbi:MAG: filamentous hemagglutinin N-terminal domain-containing protein, partial [Burkholderiaceae bacterium]|nr:filamentous hemagglutinin N-terminal domain-containing protein [Burkholderiaceae bacterium]
MNHIFFSVWCEQSQTFVAVPETTSSAGKQTSGTRARLAAPPVFRLRHFALAVALSTGTLALAVPTGGVVTTGSATVGTSAGVTTIVQGTPNVVINWQSFGLAPAEQVRFVQPGTHSIAVNRVLGADPSVILGTLTANGKVFLVNPNGILFGQGAQVHVGGLVASTLQLADGDLSRGEFRFAGDSTASVVNQGNIRAQGGQVALLGATVRNSGNIVADLGSVALAAGKSITLDFVGDGLLQVAVTEAALNALVHNGGLVQADGGQIVLNANAGSGLLQGAVNHTGVLQAHSVGTRNGRITLLGGAETAILVGGTLDASGLATGQTGGTVHVLGGTVSLSGAQVQASGDAGGGTVLVGGDYQGSGPLRRAQNTSLDSATAVKADAITAGHGGQIVVWSDGRTDVAGMLSARGGSQAGDGGLIETSGHKVSVAGGTEVNTLAPAGQTGLWLLDPPDYIIAGAGGDETPAQVTTSLAATNRLIVATNDVVVADALTWTTAQTLTLRAGNNVNINAAVTASTAGSGIVLEAGNDVNVAAAMTASGAGSVIRMTAVRDVTASGVVTASASGALIEMSAGRNTSVGVVTADGGGSINLKASNNVIVNGAVGADGGPVSLRADNDGTGPSLAGGTVVFAGAGAVSAPNTSIRFNPDGYGNTGAEIAAYVTKVTGALDARAWVFGQGVDKVYDGNVTDTLAFRGTPTLGGDVTLVPGTAAFDTKDVGTGKTVTFSGYTLGGVDVARFDLFAAAGLTTADITPAPLTVTASDVVKAYGDTPTLSGFTSAGLVNAETIGSVTETSPGQIATANVAGSPYAITPSAATGGTFTPSNYTITY